MVRFCHLDHGYRTTSNCISTCLQFLLYIRYIIYVVSLQYSCFRVNLLAKYSHSHARTCYCLLAYHAFSLCVSALIRLSKTEWLNLYSGSTNLQLIGRCSSRNLVEPRPWKRCLTTLARPLPLPRMRPSCRKRCPKVSWTMLESSASKQAATLARNTLTRPRRKCATLSDSWIPRMTVRN